MYALIVNPVAGGGRSKAELERVTALLSERDLQWKLFTTTKPGEAGEIARILVCEPLDGIIAIGGDGTMREISGGMCHSPIPMLFASCGTGNDFIKTAGLPGDVVQALKIQLDSPISKIDIGSVSGLYFLNVAGTGLDVNVLLETEKYKAKSSGLWAYLRGVADAIKHYRPVRATLSFADEPESEAHFTLISIGNGQYFGGGMRTVPGASLKDGYFDVIKVRPVKKWMILFLLTLFIPGFHAKTALATRHRAKKLRIQCAGMVLNLDGELIECPDARFEILEGALTVRLPSCI